MSAEEIDRYLEGLDDTRRCTLEHLRRSILELLPEADQGMSYGVPAFRVGGKVVAGFSAARHHLSYLPHSGSVLDSLDPIELEGHPVSKGALRFAVDEPLSRELVATLVNARLAELGLGARPGSITTTGLRDRIVEIVARLPDVETEDGGERSQHLGLSVRKKRFAWFLDDHHGDGIVAITCKAPAGANAAMVDADAARYFIPSYTGARGWVGIRLDVGEVDWDQVELSLVEAYRLTAPKTLVARLDAD